MIVLCQKTKCGCNTSQKYFCCSIETCKICLCNKYFEAYDQTIINFISLTNEHENSKDDSDDSKDLQEPHDSDDDVTVDRDFFSKNNQNNHVCSNYWDGFIGTSEPPDVEPYDISEANHQNYSTIGVVKDK